MHPSWGPNRVLGKDGMVTGIELIKCTSVFDQKGKFAPKFDSHETKKIETDKVILAIGQSPDLSWIKEIDAKNETISVNKEMQTNIAGVFAGGEVARGPASVVEAVADGASAALAIDKYLGGDGNIYQTLAVSSEPDPHIGQVEGFAKMERVDIPKISPNVRK
jgi:NADPH-dependent glutamate synthase beta subunit-like oxidoreductase